MKRLFSFVLAIVMIFSMTAFAGAVETDYNDAASHLAALDILKGDGKGNLMLDQNVTRYQAALFFVQALTGKTDVEIWNADKVSGVFSDVTQYGTAIDYAHGIGLILGRGNGVYGPNDNITYQDMLVMAVRALGYETDKMNYPYGYILAADKLGLTNDIDLVNYKAYLTRGETAQLMWNMLMTEVAYVDPLTGNILYPNETGLTDTIVDTKVDRVILLDKAGYTSDELAFTITEFIPANEKDEDSVDWVKLDNGWVINAADLGITADTPKVSYLGLGGTLYINCDATDFETKYEDGEANIVVYDFDDYTTVTNLSDKIRYTDGVLSIDGIKFKNYNISFRTFGTNGWEDAETTITENLFVYDSKDGYDENTNPYCSVAYRTYIDENKKDCVEILYTGFAFGQYNVREIDDEKYPVIATYEDTAVKNLDDEMSNFVEYLVGYNKQINANTTKVTNKQGENALSVTMAGEAVEAGDFMFYAYNSVDNILTVANVVGGFETGRLNAMNTSKETVKINGTNYEFGFDGFTANFDSDFDSYEANIKADYIDELEVGKNNVKYILVNGKIVYMEPTSETSTDSYFDYAIISTAKDTFVDELEIDEDDYDEIVAEYEGIYVEDGQAKVAMLNLETGAWELVTIGTVVDTWVADNEEFNNEHDVTKAVELLDIQALASMKQVHQDAIAAFKNLTANAIVAVVAEEDGIYTIAANEADFFVFGSTKHGLLFSDNNAKTNAITADDEINAERVTLDDETVVVVVSGTTVAVRVGVQGAEDSVATTDGSFYAAASDLIVLVADDITLDAKYTNLADWNRGVASSGLDVVYYYTTVTTGVELENNEEDEETYILTITDLYNLNTNEMVESVQVVVDEATDPLAAISGAGYILVAEGDDIAEVSETFAEIVLKIAQAENENFAAAISVDFVNADTIAIDPVYTDADAVEVVANVITINNVEDAEEYDFTEAVLNKVWTDADEDNKFGAEDVETFVGDIATLYWSVELNLDEAVVEINEPTAGIFDNYYTEIVDNGILVPLADANDFKDALAVTVTYTFVAVEEDGIVTLNIYRVLD